jgi:ADP-heptose:LPS heptosyltransferase
VTNVLVVRLDSAGDVLLAGPAIRAVAATAHADGTGARAGRVTLLAGPRGRAAAELLPGVDEIVEWRCPWIDPEPGPVRSGEVLADELLAVAEMIRRAGADSAVILTSFHQDPLPTALLLRVAGVPRITAESENYPGSLLDVRHRLPDRGLHEVERMLSVAAAAGFTPPADDDLRLRLKRPLPSVARLTAAADSAAGSEPYIVVHPGASVPARAPAPDQARAYVDALADDGWRVLVTGAAGQEALTDYVAGSRGTSLGGRTSLAELAAVCADAAAVVTGNTGPAHVVAAVGTPVVSLFAPVVPAERWRPWGVPHVLLGAQDAPCAGTRARECPVPGHPCLAVDAEQVTKAVREVCGT